MVQQSSGYLRRGNGISMYKDNFIVMITARLFELAKYGEANIVVQ